MIQRQEEYTANFSYLPRKSAILSNVLIRLSDIDPTSFGGSQRLDLTATITRARELIYPWRKMHRFPALFNCHRATRWLKYRRSAARC